MPADPAAGVRGKLVVIGQGYVGLPLSMRAVEVGWDVVGLDLDARRVDRLAAGDSYVEDVASSELRSALDSGPPWQPRRGWHGNPTPRTYGPLEPSTCHAGETSSLSGRPRRMRPRDSSVTTPCRVRSSCSVTC